MNCRTEINPFIDMFQRQYETISGSADFHRISDAVEDLLRIDDNEMVEIFANELGNTWTIWADKLAGKDVSLSSVVLKWDGDGHYPHVPTIVLADGCTSYSIPELSERSGSMELPDSPGAPLYANPTFGEWVFHEFGGFDIDFLTCFLFDAASDGEITKLPVYCHAKSLFMIKTLDLAWRAVKQTVTGERFKALPLGTPFAFFAVPFRGQKAILLKEIASL